MRILIFTEGTILMHKAAENVSPTERIRQVIDKENSVHDYSSYIPNGEAIRKVRKWVSAGVDIYYLTSRRGEQVALIKEVILRYGFPFPSNLVSRNLQESYADVATRITPDILIEDDCQSIGGEVEMTYPHIPKNIQSKIKSVVVKEFEGIDSLPDDPKNLMSF